MKSAWKSWDADTVLIVALTVAAYIPALRGGFVWDDRVAEPLDTFDATGRFSDAIGSAGKDLKLARAAGQTRLAREVEAHIPIRFLPTR